MTSRTHDLFAFAALITASVYFPVASVNIATAIISVVACIIGSLLPDIDQETNQLWDFLPAGHFLGEVFKKIFLAHRTITHSLLGIFIVFGLLGWILPKIFNPGFVDADIVFSAIMIGFISHIAIDSITEEGVPLFFPLTLKVGFPPIKSWRIKTGKWFEKYVVFPVILIYIVWFISKNYDKLNKIIKL